MKGRHIVWLYSDDIAAVLTINGHFAGIWCHTECDQIDYGDVIQEMMGLTMKQDPLH